MSINTYISDKRKRQCEKLIEISENIIQQAFSKYKSEELGTTWTGGKDSGLTLWIIRQYCMKKNFPLPRTMIIGEGDEFEEIESFVQEYTKSWGVQLEWCRNEDVLKAAGHKLGRSIDVHALNDRNKQELAKIGFEESTFPFEAQPNYSHRKNKLRLSNRPRRTKRR